MRRFWCLAAAALFVWPAVGWCRQDSQAQTSAPQKESLADAARRAREQKKETPKAAKVFTNDNLPAAGSVSAAAQPPASESEAEGTEAATTPAGEAAAKDAGAAWREKFIELRQKLARDQADLAVMQRELGVLDVQNYNDPVKAMQQQLTRSDMNKKTADIEAMKKSIAADQQAIADAEDQLRKSGGDSGWAR